MPYVGLGLAEGATASLELERLMFRDDTMPLAERQHLRDAPLRYCAVDTMSMVRLLERLRELSSTSTMAYRPQTRAPDQLARCGG